MESHDRHQHIGGEQVSAIAPSHSAFCSRPPITSQWNTATSRPLATDTRIPDNGIRAISR
ncbi:hypothetical protein C7H85_01815 [Zobellella endophytica]|uniref:Uncharacterized protein n=1 Tax=Zobellella endophytica TaxID=2116700 RepID=A0A2P7RBP8_9GAMM|nr:hypothetical protein C7H85_01815 [Zobellella endophytica]